MKKSIKLFALLFMLVININLLIAQPEQDEDIDDVPVDAGISLLAGAGAVFGIKKMNKKYSLKEKSPKS